MKQIAQRLNATTDQVLMAWAKAKGVVVVTYVLLLMDISKQPLNTLRTSMSTKKSRLEGYIKAGDLGAYFGEVSLFAGLPEAHLSFPLELTDDDISALDQAGSVGSRFLIVKTIIRRGATVALVAAGALALCSYLGVDVF
jgi:hypothetical protein